LEVDNLITAIFNGMGVKSIVKSVLLEYLNENSVTNNHIYHGTGKGQALNIQKDGFMKPNSTGEEKPSISFTDNLDYAKYYANAKGGATKMVILRTELNNTFKLSPRIKNNKGVEYVTFTPISAYDLEIITPDNNWVPLNSWDVVFNEPKTSDNN